MMHSALRQLLRKYPAMPVWIQTWTTEHCCPPRDYEALLEATYSFEIVPGFTVQPNLQYVFHPGQIVDRTEPQGLHVIPNAFVVGMRTTVKY